MTLGGITILWNFFVPPDPPITDIFGPESSLAKIERHMKDLHRWRLKVTYTLAAGAIMVAIALFTSWGFVRASDLKDKVNSEITKSNVAQSVEQIKEEQRAMKKDLAEVKASIDNMTPALKEIYKSSTASTICRLLAAKLRIDADKEQDKYKAVAGEFYPESRCGGN